VSLWLDNHLSPALAVWITDEFKHQTLVVRDVGLASAADIDIFRQAREAGVALMTKDRDFAELVDRLGAPPAIILLTCGNTSTAYLCTLLRERLPAAFALINDGEPLVEIGGEG
jgi:predicted nuclease of predicted toxin-antitoxin system